MTNKLQTTVTTTDIAIQQENIFGLYNGVYFPDVDKNTWIDTGSNVITPRELLQLEELYATSDLSMLQVAERLTGQGNIQITNTHNNIDYKNIFYSWVNLTKKHEGVRTIHAISKAVKADTIGSQALKQYTGAIPGFCFNETVRGARTLSGAGITYLKNKHDALLRHAEILERGQYAARREEADRATIINNNITVSLKDLMNQPIDTITDADFTED